MRLSQQGRRRGKCAFIFFPRTLQGARAVPGFRAFALPEVPSWPAFPTAPGLTVSKECGSLTFSGTHQPLPLCSWGAPLLKPVYGPERILWGQCVRISHGAISLSLVLQPRSPSTLISPFPAPAACSMKADFVLLLPPGSLSAQHSALSIVIPEIWLREKSPHRGGGDGQESERESVWLGAFLASVGMTSSGTRLEPCGASSPSVPRGLSTAPLWPQPAEMLLALLCSKTPAAV